MMGKGEAPGAHVAEEGGAHAVPAWARQRRLHTAGWVKVVAAGITGVALATALVKMNTTTVSLVRPANGPVPSVAPDSEPAPATNDPAVPNSGATPAAPPTLSAGPPASAPGAPEEATGGGRDTTPGGAAPSAAPGGEAPGEDAAGGAAGRNNPPDYVAPQPSQDAAPPPVDQRTDDNDDRGPLVDLLTGGRRDLFGRDVDANRQPADECQPAKPIRLSSTRAEARERRKKFLERLFGLSTGTLTRGGDDSSAGSGNETGADVAPGNGKAKGNGALKPNKLNKPGSDAGCGQAKRPFFLF
jgi:hypothetical protein